MKKIVLSMLILFSVLGISAQEQGKVRGGLTLDLTLPRGGLGVGGNLDFRYNIFHNWNVGINVGLAGMAKDAQFTGNNELLRANSSLVTNVTAITDFYFNWGRSIFAPFIGGGLGAYFLSNVAFDNNTNYNDVRDIRASAKFGGHLRIGFELTKFRMSAAYHFIPKSEVQDIHGNRIGTVRNGYFDFAIGFYLGGGKWKRFHR